MYETQLKELGLTDNEVHIYLLLLKRGALNPSEISENLGLHRGYVYDALERMHEKEIVNRVLRNNKKFFQASSPKSIIELLKFRLENFQKIVPSLMSLAETTKERTNIEVHKGKRVCRTLVKDIISTLKKNEEACLIGVDQNFLINELEPVYLKQYLSKIRSEGIKERIIIKRGAKKLAGKNVYYREINKEKIGNSVQITYKNKVALFMGCEPHQLIIIEDKELADTYKKQFELLWEIAT
jgi:sugar-specific transcriptional regulator TrmB